MRQNGIIEPAASPWASNVVLAKKKDGSLRLCVDYRNLNAVTYQDTYPLPHIDTCLNTLQGAAWFSTLAYGLVIIIYPSVRWIRIRRLLLPDVEPGDITLCRLV